MVSPVIIIKGDTPKQRRDVWFKHFHSLLGKETDTYLDITAPFFNMQISNALPINTGPFTSEELKKCTNKLQNSKTPGPDFIPAIIWKSPLFHDILLEFCNETKTGNKPKALSLSSILPIPKKGDLSLPTNYRGITLSVIASKLYNSMILSRISEYVDPILRRNQNGFRKGRSTIPQILALRRIIEEMKIGKQKATIIFVDFAKAFDSVDRKAMLHILKNYGIPDDIIRAIAIMYENPETFVNTSDGPTQLFKTTTGILQGDTLAPYLFVIVVDYILRQSADSLNAKGIDIKPTKTSRETAKYLTDLDYADDIALLSQLLQDAQELLLSLEEAASRFGLLLNSKKTEYLTLNEDTNHLPLSSSDGYTLNEVSDFNY